MARHESLRPYVADATELYDLLGRMQGLAYASIGRRLIAFLVLLAAGFVTTDALSQAAFCLAALMSFAVIWSIADYIGRDCLMHLVTLQDVIRPKGSADVLSEALWAQAISEVEAGGAAKPGEVPTDGQAQSQG